VRALSASEGAHDEEHSVIRVVSPSPSERDSRCCRRQQNRLFILAWVTLIASVVGMGLR